MINEMKKEVAEYIEKHQNEIIELGNQLFTHPELGFREFKTAEIITEYRKKHNLKIDKHYAYTGLSISIGSGRPHIGVLAEMDAIPTQGHPCADPETTAAHACGHSTQGTATLAALEAVNHVIGQLKGTVTLFYTPAEEFTDLEYRKGLIREGKIKYLSGKENMLVDGLFEDVDCILHLHAMGGSEYRFSVGSTLAGFIYKKITFIGKAAHAAMMPHLGVNALNECALFLNAVAYLRETFRDEDMVRIHGIIDDGGNTVNSIPDKVVYECYVRTANYNILQTLNKQLTDTAHHCAAAIGGSCIVEDIPGYFPLIQDENLSRVVEDNILDYADARTIKHNETSVAGGDVGDICLFKPIIQYGYTGISGRIHGADMRVEDPYEVYVLQTKILAGSIIDLLQDPEKVEYIKKNFQPKMTMEDYIKYLEG